METSSNTIYLTDAPAVSHHKKKTSCKPPIASDASIFTHSNKPSIHLTCQDHVSVLEEVRVEVEDEGSYFHGGKLDYQIDRIDRAASGISAWLCVGAFYLPR